MNPEYEAVWRPAFELTWSIVHPGKAIPAEFMRWMLDNSHSGDISSVPLDRMKDRSVSSIAGKFLDLEGNAVDENPAVGKPVLIAGAPWPTRPGAMMGRCKACGGFVGLSPTSRDLIKHGSIPVCRDCFDLIMFVEGTFRATSSA